MEEAITNLLQPRHLLIEDLDPNEVYVNNDLYNNSDIEVRYAQALDPWRWTRGWTHAMGMSLFIIGVIIIFVLLYIQDMRIDHARLRTAIANADKDNTTGAEGPYVHKTFIDRISTHLRSFTYKRTPSRWWYMGLGNMSLGLALIIAATWAYPLLYVFTQRPYYMLRSWYGPPGISSRSGMIAVSTTPFIIALSLKANLISAITGVGHERLNVLHRWLALLAGFLAVVHTVPFLVEPYKEGGWSAIGNKLTHGKGNIYYWNGLGALICLAWLNLASLPFIRKWCYEFFVHLHIICGVGYLGMMFWHCNNMLSSWHYLWATVVIWVIGLVWRFVFKTNWFSSRKWFSGDMATISRLTDDGVKVTIATKMKWRPGQHVFLRIPEIGLFDNHPFTIASVMRDEDDIPSPSSNMTNDTTAQLKGGEPTATVKHENDGKLARARKNQQYGDSGADEYNDMVLVFKPYKGFTKKVFDISRSRPDITYRAFLDGPYGGMPRKLESFDTVLMIAGGSGITPVVAHLQDLCRKIRSGKAVTQDVRIVWTVKRFESLEWFKDEISVACRSVPFGLVHCQYFVTEESPVEFCDYPVSATMQWPTSPAIPDWDTTKPKNAESIANSPNSQIGAGGTETVTTGLGLSVPEVASFPLPGTAVTITEKSNFPMAYPQYPSQAHVHTANNDQLRRDSNRDSVPSPMEPVMPAEQPYNPHHTPPIATDTPAFVVPTEAPAALSVITDTHPNPFSTPANDPQAAESKVDPFLTPVAGPGEKKLPLPEIVHTASSPVLGQTDANPNDNITASSSTAPTTDPAADATSTIDPQQTGLAVTTDATAPGSAHKKNKPSLRLSLPAYQGEEVDGIVRCPSPHHPDGPDGKRISYGPADFGDEVMIEFGRPRLREGIRPWAEGFGRRTCIYVCGPERMKIDVSNAVASLQMDIWRKENIDREEVYLHTETFGW